MNNASRLAFCWLLGSLLSPSPVRNGLHAATNVRPATASAICRDRFMIASRLAVEGEGENKRARLGIVEVIHPSHRRDGAAQARLGIVPAVLRPRVQVASRHANVDAADAERARHPRRIERVRHRDLAQLYEPAVFDARLIDARERTGRVAIAIPVLADRYRGPGTGSRHGTVEPTALPERPHRAPGLGVLMRSVAPERALRAVPDLPAVPDINQTGQLQLAVMETAADAAGPARIGIRQNAGIVVDDGESGAVNEERSLRRGWAGCIEVREHARRADAAPHEPDPPQHAELLADLRDVLHEVADAHEVRTTERQDHAAVLGPLKAKIPPVIGPLNRPDVERHLEPAVAERRRIACLQGEAGARRRDRRQENDVLGLGIVVREAQVRLVAEQAEVEARLELFGPLRPQIGGTPDRALDETAESSLGWRLTRALRDAGHDRVGQEVGRREVGLRLLPRLAVRDA